MFSSSQRSLPEGTRLLCLPSEQEPLLPSKWYRKHGVRRNATSWFPLEALWEEVGAVVGKRPQWGVRGACDLLGSASVPVRRSSFNSRKPLERVTVSLNDNGAMKSSVSGQRDLGFVLDVPPPRPRQVCGLGPVIDLIKLQFSPRKVEHKEWPPYRTVVRIK